MHTETKGLSIFLFIPEGEGSTCRKEGSGGKERRLAEKKHGTVAQWVFGDSCQVNVLDLSKLRSEKRHSAGRIEVLYRYMAIYLSNGRLTRILVIVNKRFRWEPIENCRMDSWTILTWTIFFLHNRRVLYIFSWIFRRVCYLWHLHLYADDDCNRHMINFTSLLIYICF